MNDFELNSDLSANKILIAEVSTSPGPRKSFDNRSAEANDPELGEDSGGALLVGGTHAFAWVADGTSDQANVGPFNSRRLAQDLCRLFSSCVMESWSDFHRDPPSAGDALTRWMNDSIIQVLKDWQRQSAKQEPVRETLLTHWSDLESAQQDDPARQLFFEFSTTFSTAHMASNGDFHACSIGDSFLLLHGTSQTVCYGMDPVSVTFRLKMEEGRAEWKHFIPSPQNINSTGVELALLSTDGSRDTIRFLYETLQRETPVNRNHYLNIKKNLPKIKPKTQDDKTLALLARWNES